MKVKAYAKLNLFLKVVEKKDGYHQLEMVNVLLSLYDVLTFTKIKKRAVQVVVKNASIAEQANLVYRVATKILNDCQPDSGVKITLYKHIPIGGGLGGGSSDAAATIKALNALWSLKLTPTQLQGYALEFGRDIPFFLSGYKTALVTGTGEVVCEVVTENYDKFTLVIPHFSASTKTVFENYKVITDNSKTADDFLQNKIGPVNDLFIDHPYSKEYEKIAKAIKAPMYLTGSGSCLYLLGYRCLKHNKLYRIKKVQRLR